ncbi:transposase [Streptomyces sp. NBC_01478]|uniref:transposase n=1 Tax=Streptomyces sp. NBC_01478 TaxID=2903882 RepID=UPI002E2EEE1A|nr:transposase [Streptomyces sp. NBC_01478]
MLFADQVGIRSDQVTGRTWGEKGRTPTVRRTGNRFSVDAMSAISTKGRMHFMVFTEIFDADVMCPNGPGDWSANRPSWTRSSSAGPAACAASSISWACSW